MARPHPIHTAANKASLDFLCSSQSSMLSPYVTPPFLSMSTKPRSTLERLPRDVLALIAFHLVVDDSGIGRHPSALMPLYLTCRVMYDAICFDNNPKLYYNLFRATFDYTALTRRYGWMVKNIADVAGRGRKIFDLFSDLRSWAIDYKTRWDQSWRMRQVVKHGRIEIQGICDSEQLTADLWNIWFLLTENGESDLTLCFFTPDTRILALVRCYLYVLPLCMAIISCAPSSNDPLDVGEHG